MDQPSTSAAASQAGDRSVRSAPGRSCSGFSHAGAVDALCCVPYVVTLLRPTPRLGTVAVTTPTYCPSFIPAPVPFLNRRSQLHSAYPSRSVQLEVSLNRPSLEGIHRRTSACLSLSA